VSYSRDEVVQIGHLSEDVISDDQARSLALRDEARGKISSEKRNQRRHSARLGGLRNIAGGIDA
jgi:hypothetical protein